MANSDYYTIRGYHRRQPRELSDTMEDYLEMICRHTQNNNYIRINQLASLLNVKPPAASKMAAKLKQIGMIEYEPYGIIKLTAHGMETGQYLLRRHEILHRLFCFINHSENELELVEKIEHSFNEDTIRNIELLLQHDDLSLKT